MAYIFEKIDGAWIQVEPTLTFNDGGLAKSVSISGDQAIIGAGRAAYIFEKINGTWEPVFNILTALDNFGHSVSISGDQAIIGAPGNNNGNGDITGMAYIFEKIGGYWQRTRQVRANDGFGNSVSISGDQAIVGAIDYDEWQLPLLNPGVAYIFKKTNGDWMKVEPTLTVINSADEYCDYINRHLINFDDVNDGMENFGISHRNFIRIGDDQSVS